MVTKLPSVGRRWMPRWRQARRPPIDLPVSPLTPTESWVDGVLAISDGALILTESEGRILGVSRGAEKLFGSERTGLLGRNLGDLFVKQRGDGEVPSDKAGALCHRADGSVLEVSVHSMSLGEAGGGAQVVSLRTPDEPEVAGGQPDEGRPGFLANVCHELRSPLTVILGYSELLADMSDEDDVATLKRAVEPIRRHAERLKRVVDDLLRLAKLEGGTVIHPEEVELDILLRAVLDECALDAERWDVRVAPDLLARTDPDGLAEIVANLIETAEHYGAPPFTLEATRSGSTGVTIRVSDHGAGIEEAFDDHPFEQFARSDRARHQGDSGLALAICRSLAAALGGELRYESNTPGGTFTLRLAHTDAA